MNAWHDILHSDAFSCMHCTRVKALDRRPKPPSPHRFFAAMPNGQDGLLAHMSQDAFDADWPIDEELIHLCEHKHGGPFRTPETHKAHWTHGTHRTHRIHKTQRTHKTHKTHRTNMTHSTHKTHWNHRTHRTQDE